MCSASIPFCLSQKRLKVLMVCLSIFMYIEFLLNTCKIVLIVLYLDCAPLPPKSKIAHIICWLYQHIFDIILFFSGKCWKSQYTIWCNITINVWNMNNEGKIFNSIAKFWWFVLLIDTNLYRVDWKKKYILDMIVIKIDKTNINSTRQQTQLNHF